MRAIAKVFKHGRSQAVRLPKECRFAGKEVRVTKVGNRLILEPLADNGAMPWALIDQLGDTPFMPEGREQPSMQHDREVFEE
jgi:antitoxin VapB